MSPFRIARPRFLAYFACELGLVLGVISGLAYVTLLLTAAPSGSLPSQSVLAVTAMFCVALFTTQWYAFGHDGSLIREVLIFTLISGITGLIGYVGIRLLLSGQERQLLGLLALEAGIAVPVTVAGWRWLSSRFNIIGGLRERVLILGTGEMARDVCRWIVAHHSSEYGVIGFADENAERYGNVLAMGVRIQTDYDSLAGFCATRADRVIVALDEKRGKLPVRQLMELRLLGVGIEEATTFLEKISGKIAVETMLPSWLIYSEGFKTTQLRLIFKRIVDIMLSAALLVVALPIAALCAIAVRLESRGPALYRQQRVGRDGKPFNLLKFRSMRDGAEKNGPEWTSKFDPRITRVGHVIRKLRIDELPQLINVLRGEMSFVGPRPERPHFVRQLEEKIAYYGLRTIVRPGITGWAQVQYGYADSEEDTREKLKYDLFYIKNGNLMLDLWIVLKTVKVVLLGTGAR